jgi:hypothetical protein
LKSMVSTAQNLADSSVSLARREFPAS